MNHKRLFLILGLVVAVPVFGQQTSQNKIGPGFLPADIYAVEPAKEREITDERPIIRDFRNAPEVPEALTSPQKKSGGSGSISAQSADEESAMDLLSAQKYSAAEHQFEKLLQSDTSAENYAGLAESLAMQNKVHEAEVVLREARAHNFANDSNVAAVGGHVCYLHANVVSYAKYDLYMEASVVLCKRALAVDPHNQIALATLEKVRSKRLEKGKEFEKNGDLVLAQFEYENLLKEKNDDIDASSALSRLLRLRRLSETTMNKVNSAFNEIPAQTKVQIAFDTPLNSDTSKPGDKFSARTLEPITEMDGYVVLPEGAVTKGTVTQSGEWTSDQHISKKGRVQLRFDSIEAIGIAPIPLVAELVSHGGVIASKRHGQNIPIPTSAVTTLPFTWLCAKKGTIIDVRVGDQFSLEFPDGVRVFRGQ